MGQAAQTLEAALASVVPALLAKLGQVKLSEITVEFGIKLTAEARAVITNTARECNFSVTLHRRQASPDG